jgi:FkbM family methyltransferase
MKLNSRKFRFVIGRLVPERLLRSYIHRAKPSNEVNIKIRPAGKVLNYVTNPSDDLFFSAFFKALANWEESSLTWWAEQCNSAKVVLDIGSYTGIYSLVAAASGAKRVVAFDPNPAIQSAFHKNMNANESLSRIIELKPIGLGRAKQKYEMMIPMGRPTSSGLHLVDSETFHTNAAPHWVSQGTIDVLSGDELLDLNLRSCISAIKIDVEGLEFEVLEGLVETINSSRPSLIIEALDSPALERVSKFLSDKGYDSPRWMGPPGVTDDNPEAAWASNTPYRNFTFSFNHVKAH